MTTFTVQVRISEDTEVDPQTRLAAPGARADLVLTGLSAAEVADTAYRLTSNGLYGLGLDRAPSPVLDAEPVDAVHQLELGARAVQPLVFHVDPSGRHEFTRPAIFNTLSVALSKDDPNSLMSLTLPEPISAEPGDTLYVKVSSDLRTAVVQHDTEGALARTLATAMQVPESSHGDLVDHAAAASMVLADVEAFATGHGYPLRNGQVSSDVTAMLWDVRLRIKAFAAVTRYASSRGYSLNEADLVRDTEHVLAKLDEQARLSEVARRIGMPTNASWEQVDAELVALLKRVPAAGDAALEGETWPGEVTGTKGTHLVLEPAERGDSTAMLSVYTDGDGPSVCLDAATLREVAARLIGRADELDPAPDWEDPHDEVKGTVSWPAVYDPEYSHASTTCCGRIECIDAAADWVKSVTGHLGVWMVHTEKGQ